MAESVPASIPKNAAPFLARSRELNLKDPVMAYWCKFKAAQICLDDMPGDDEGRKYLEGLMDDLEEAKGQLADNELVTDDAAGSAYIYNFASRVFEGADRQDRNGKATRLTAREFLAASVFFDVLSIFGQLETDVSEKITYAKWKASSIAKAFREGRVPTPGPAPAPAPAQVQEGDDSSDDVARQLLGTSSKKEEGEYELPSAPLDPAHELPSAPTDGHEYTLPSAPTDEDTLPSAPSDSTTLPSAPTDSSILPSAPSAPPAPLPITRIVPPPPKTPSQPPPAPVIPPQPLPAPAPAPPAEREWKPAPSAIDPSVVGAAQKHAKWAISALNYEDVETARKELRAALALIGG